MRIEDMVEMVYSSSDLLEESPFIHNPDNLYRELVTKVNSRYKISGVNYKPYTLTQEVLDNLFNRIIVVPALGNVTRNELINYNSDKMVVYDITLPSKVMHNGDLTPSGLFCVRLGSANGDVELYEKVIDQLSKFMTVINNGFNQYWLPNKLMSDFSEVNPNLLMKLVRRFGYRWVLK